MRDEAEQQRDSVRARHPAVDDEQRRDREEHRERECRRAGDPRRDVERKQDERREPAQQHRPAHREFGEAEGARFVPVEDPERNAVVGEPEIAEHLERTVQQDLMHGMPFVVDQHLRGELVEADPRARRDHGGEKPGPCAPEVSSQPRLGHRSRSCVPAGRGTPPDAPLSGRIDMPRFIAGAAARTRHPPTRPRAPSRARVPRRRRTRCRRPARAIPLRAPTRNRIARGP